MKWLLSIIVVMLSVSAKAELRIAYMESPSPPRVMGDGESIPENPGASVDLLNQIAKDLKIDIQFARMPWARGMGMLKAGMIDGIFHASFNAERDQFSAYPKHDGKVDASKRMFDQA